MSKEKFCRQCGKELPAFWSTDICLECSRENVRKIFEEYPDVEKAFKDSIREMKKELEAEMKYDKSRKN